MSAKLIDIYKEAAGDDVEQVYVFPRIERSSINNPYLELLYEDVKKEISINSVNPLIPKFLYRKIFGEKSVVHYHWLEFCNAKEFLILAYKLSMLFIYLLSGGEVVWTMHNLTPHCKKFKKSNLFIRKWMLSIVKVVILHSEKVSSTVSTYYRIPKSMIRVVPHPSYKVIIRNKQDSLKDLSKELGIKVDPDKPLFMMYGRISSYKGIMEVLKVFIKNEYQLIIAGDTAKESEEYVHIIKELSNRTDNIWIINRFIKTNEEQILFGAADVCIFNFSKMLSSGSILLAESYKKHIIAPQKAKILTSSDTEINTFSDHSELSKTIENLNSKLLKS